MMILIHIKMKVINWLISKCSFKRNIPKKNIMVGAIYCKNPVKDNGIFLAPALNSTSGVAVTTPANNNQALEVFIPNVILFVSDK